MGSAEAQGATGVPEPERDLAGGKYSGSDSQPCRAHQPEEEEEARHAELQPFSMVTAPNQLWCMDLKGTS